MSNAVGFRTESSENFRSGPESLRQPALGTAAGAADLQCVWRALCLGCRLEGEGCQHASLKGADLGGWCFLCDFGSWQSRRWLPFPSAPGGNGAMREIGCALGKGSL